MEHDSNDFLHHVADALNALGFGPLSVAQVSAEIRAGSMIVTLRPATETSRRSGRHVAQLDIRWRGVTELSIRLDR